VLDITLRSDALVAKMLQYLDNTVGHGRYSVAVTADHGICPLPEVSVKKGLDAKRVDVAKLTAAAEKQLATTFGAPDGTAKWLEAVSPPWVYLNEKVIAAKKLNKETVAATLAGWLRGQPDLQLVYTTDQLRGPAGGDETLERVQKAYFPERAGDLYVLLKPLYLFGDSVKGKGTSHGTPYDYDRHVPLLVYGPGVRGGRREEAVTPQQTAAVTAHFLGLAPPKDSAYGLPKTLAREIAP
jgi:hypothetical protein